MNKSFQLHKTLLHNKLAISHQIENIPKQAIQLLEIMREFDAHGVYYWQRMIIDYWKETNKPIGTRLTKKQANEIRDSIAGLLEDKCSEFGWIDPINRFPNCIIY